MPIRFRCPKCQGLLSIARRKAGMKTACPNCRADVNVPLTDEIAASEPATAAEPTKQAPATGAAMVKVRVANGKIVPKPTGDPPSEPLFERPDFEKLIDPNAKSTASNPAASAVKTPSPTAPPASHPMTEAEGGFYVGRGAVAVLAVMMVVLVALAFATGFLLGS